MVPVEAVMVPLSKALGLSVVVERAIEFGKNLLEPLLTSRDTRAQPNMEDARQAVADVQTLAQNDAAARAVEESAESRVASRTEQSAQLQAARTQLLSETDPAKRAALLTQAAQLKQSLTTDEQHGEWDERVPSSVLLVEDATDPDDGWTLRAFVLQLLGFAAGILLASFSDLRLFGAFLGGAALPGWADHVFTGLFIGGGSGPVHTLIQFISERKTAFAAAELAVAESADEKAPPPARPQTPAVITPAADAAADVWADIPYAGGVDLDLLESVHRRDANPDLVVYHHTAMSSDSTFEDVVRVIKSRTDASGTHWLTGYNCVILADGSIHAFCRWDRYGSHAVGFNRRSLGISFNGNFETNPNVPFSNPDGRYGTPRPTEPQLRAGARVVALWTFLYPIPLDFHTAIIPHKQIASKACPGSNFPYDGFEKLVTFYRQKWEQSTLAQERIGAFKLKPYVYV
jgi:hypothetical protein